MMQSNKPYHRVDDGIGAGLVTGGLIGGAASAGAIYGGGSALRGLMKADLSSMQKRSVKYMDNPTEKNNAKMAKMADRGKRRMSAYESAGKGVGKLAGMGGRGKAMAIGGSVIGAALAGAGIDKLNN